ncbi:response regulator [Dyadobacter tibetensis]|uniref:response regulator n=1 Tax=Dyadobacter tibetensis TaxID=1211851 RepID=UPI0004700E1D|nr:response regulator [Dyadobacter tibetensis]
MPQTTVSSNSNKDIIPQLKIVFTLSIGLLLASLIASFYSTKQLIKNSELVSHNQEVLLTAESIISFLKDAETGQRGYLLTTDESFLQPYEGSYSKVSAAYIRLNELTGASPVQQKTLMGLKERYEARFAQMERVINLVKNNNLSQASREDLHREMLLGKKIMDDIRVIVQTVVQEENRQLTASEQDQKMFIQFTPYFLVLAALISILITVMAFLRIQSDIRNRIKKEQESEEVYRKTRLRISNLEKITRQIKAGDYSVRSKEDIDDELGRISTALNDMTTSLQTTFNDLKNRTWLQEGAIKLGDAMRGERILSQLSEKLLQALVKHVDAQVGAMYVREYDVQFQLYAHYGGREISPTLSEQDGIAGQAIRSGKIMILEKVPSEHFQIHTALGTSNPTAIILIPLQYGGETIAVIELACLHEPDSIKKEFLERNQDVLAIGVNSALDYLKLQNFLEETQAQSEELQAQHQELENLNAELEAQSQKLQASEEELRVQQEELQQTNEELEERSNLLEERNQEILKKAQELELSTRYKSEFLANMSHELRTPLNSILLLSRLLRDNDTRNLSADQVEYASVINASGNGLLALIDEILDLSKIEAGKMELDFRETDLNSLAREWTALFLPLAKEKDIEFRVDVDQSVQPIIETDRMRLDQIIKNLVSNAVKFTKVGSVILKITNSETAGLLQFIVEDTGIGIPPEKQTMIFEAFQQADGSTKRKYGGTGLGLSISKELIRLLNGELKVESEVNKGSKFTLTLPVKELETPKQALLLDAPKAEPLSPPANQFLSTVIPEAIPDDRSQVKLGDRVILIIEDDIHFAKALLDYTRSKGYKGVVAVRGDEGLQLANTFMPLGIILDLQLPIISGWEIMDQLKKNVLTRHIPIHIMSSHRMKNESLMKGAIDFIDKPRALDHMKEVFEKIEYVISKKAKKVLIVEDNPKHAKALAYYLGTFDINSELKQNIDDGMTALQSKEVDCVILDMGIPDQKAYETLEALKKQYEHEHIPIIIFTGKSLSINEEYRIKQYADSIIVKTAHSYQRMLDEVSLFLHIMEENKTEPKPKVFGRNLRGMAEVLEGKTVLIADDDVRNIFSLSKSMETYKMNVITALDGKEAMKKLEQHPEINVVLLDMMMPNMDGYETARRIRSESKWRTLPIIAVTAKAMMGDREKCINAGASDYITKPVDVDQLISLLRVWLFESF